MLKSPEFAQAVLVFLLFIIAGMLGLVYVLASALRRLIVSVTDARSREEDSPLGIHKADAKAHEPMRDDLLEKIDERLAKLEQEMKRNLEEDRRMTAAVLAQNERLLDELTRVVDIHRNCPVPPPAVGQNLVPRR